MVRAEVILLHGADGFNGCQDAKDAVIVSSFRDTVPMRAAHDGRKIFIDSCIMADHIAKSIDADGEACCFHQAHQVLTSGPVCIGKSQAMDAISRRGDGFHMSKCCF